MAPAWAQEVLMTTRSAPGEPINYQSTTVPNIIQERHTASVERAAREDRELKVRSANRE